LCGKYKRMKHRGVICDKCGVEVTLARVRRERLGHIELASPCSHVCSSRDFPAASATCWISRCVNSSASSTSRLTWWSSRAMWRALKRGEVITDERKRQLDQEFPGKFVAMMGAEGIKELLKKLDIEGLSEEIREKDEDRVVAAEEAEIRQAPARGGKLPQSGNSRNG